MVAPIGPTDVVAMSAASAEMTRVRRGEESNTIDACVPSDDDDAELWRVMPKKGREGERR